MAWFPEKPSTRHERLTAERNQLETQLNRVNLALSKIENLRLLGDKHVSERLSPDAVQHREVLRLDDV
jgi:hypothetical protein